ncbi:flavin containing amine oxidase [Aspergillus nomiae NRRL 13137]|uniref:monoamine oxidase n=1 Tax=Aspergillus nomiae NRRL (strain ATCC 15546 / NRRL 13137 / CBS 260.88 / M93) TaxID=1509407 RepID=A0A0L1IVD5_ASPN3|nr:flavin containing amine oxidase [Aspergillus nomiae NRRL 13137]KNG83153.1 flavin containing amine oxidase [Aspergillus nomiae NRRL 13137]
MSLDRYSYMRHDRYIILTKCSDRKKGSHGLRKMAFSMVHGLTTATVVPSTPKSDLSSSYDVIVIGAGFAGLTAARDLAFKEKKDSKVEIGGTWVHWQQPHVFSELQRYGLDDFEETVAFPENCESTAKESRSQPAIVSDPAEGRVMMEQLEGLKMKFFDVDGQGGRSIIPFPFSTASSVKQNPDYLELDRLSVSDRVAQLEGCTQEQQSMLSAHAASFYGISPEKASSTMKYKLAKGTTAFALAILENYKGDRILNSPVTSITQGDGDFPATVTLRNGEQYLSKTVISTVPINVISSIVFDPPFSTLRTEAFATGVTLARTDKVLVCTSTEFKNGFNVSYEGGDMPYASGFTDGSHGDHTLLTLLVHPDNGLDGSDENIRLVESLRPAGIQVETASGHLWSDDQYAGGVMPVRGPGFLQKYNDEIRKPHGNVYFCGSDFADGWRGFISGAFEDAYRVTREILRQN